MAQHEGRLPGYTCREALAAPHSWPSASRARSASAAFAASFVGTEAADALTGTAGAGPDLCARPATTRVTGLEATTTTSRPAPAPTRSTAGRASTSLHRRNRATTGVMGGSGSDVVYAGADDDELIGGPGMDHLFGQVGDDRLFGGPDDDRLYAGTDMEVGEADFADGGSGADQITSDGDRHSARRPGRRHDQADGERVTVDGGPDADRVRTGSGDDDVTGGSGADEIFTGRGKDVVDARRRRARRRRLRQGPRPRARGSDRRRRATARSRLEHAPADRLPLVAADGLTVTVTGPTGDLGIALVDALERSRRVKKIVGMARRPFDPASQGWKKTEYREGDVQDRESVARRGEGRRRRRPPRLRDPRVERPDARRQHRRLAERLRGGGRPRAPSASVTPRASPPTASTTTTRTGSTRTIPPRGSDAHFYSAQKAEVEGVLGEALLKATRTKAWVFRPCIVAGPKAQTMIEEIPYVRMSQAMPDPVRRLLSRHAGAQAGDPRPGHPVPARPRGRRRAGVRRTASTARASRAPTTSPATAR